MGGVLGILLQQIYGARRNNRGEVARERQSLVEGLQARLNSAETRLGEFMSSFGELQEALRTGERLHREDELMISKLGAENRSLKHRIHQLELRVGGIDSDYENNNG